jgi:hypothetical protein
MCLVSPLAHCEKFPSDGNQTSAALLPPTDFNFLLLQAIDARATHFFRVCVLVAGVVRRPRVPFAPAILCSAGACAIVQSLIAFVVLNVLLCSFRNINLC